MLANPLQPRGLGSVGVEADFNEADFNLDPADPVA
jgi:hypothetical protein